MSKTLSRLVFGLWIVGAPLVMIGCSEGEKPATTTPGTETTPPPPAPGEPASPSPTPAPATPPAEPAAPAK
jgi:hypothetical protein